MKKEIVMQEEPDQPGNEAQSRRQFFTTLYHVGSVVTAGAILSQILEACGQNPLAGGAPDLQNVQGTAAGGKVTLTIDANSPLAAVGTGAVVQFSSGSLLVAHTGTNTFTALSSVCTHQSCLITGYRDQQFVCNCHGSEFSATGQVTRGPARASLTSFPTQFANNVLTITL